MCVCTDEAVVHSEERHLTGLVEQVGKSYEGVGRVQIQDEHSSDERHALHLNTTERGSKINGSCRCAAALISNTSSAKRNQEARAHTVHAEVNAHSWVGVSAVKEVSHVSVYMTAWGCGEDFTQHAYKQLKGLNTLDRVSLLEQFITTNQFNV